MWICKDCGQDSRQDSTECEICGAQRSKTETAVQPKRSGNKFFEIDGQKVAFAPADSGAADRTSERGDFG